MSSKTSLVSVFGGYISTLHKNGDTKIYVRDVAAQIAIPIAIGAAFGVATSFGLVADDATEGFFGNAMTAVSIVSSLTCGVALQVFSIRGEMAHARREGDRDSSFAEKDIVLVDELFKDVVWAIVVGFSSVVAMAVYGLGLSGAIGSCIAGVVVTLLAHALQVSRMCVKRLYGVYEIASRFWWRGRI
ncbi:hypothetical protein [Olsenella uli]|uniref:hypothetical protein n=1 Tax=Olsenella uli TaxID=133926 RepID=UPI000446110E|nr:hypothetical protein [Olsenella uli]EUB32417.1 hypothetical protein HMPREF1503_1150 [Olsenella uli MSTE5]